MRWERTYTLEEIDQVVTALKAWGARQPRWLLYGPMGAGKTTLVRHWIGTQVQSPTFTYINAYDDGIYHIDLYRFSETDYARWEAVYEILERAEKVFVEWPEKLPWPVPRPYVEVRIDVLSSLERHLTAQVIEADYQLGVPPPHTPL
jgi:tRNA threonylcarbamoyladenosine biosynthesis protein TsaE